MVAYRPLLLSVARFSSVKLLNTSGGFGKAEPKFSSIVAIMCKVSNARAAQEYSRMIYVMTPFTVDRTEPLLVLYF